MTQNQSFIQYQPERENIYEVVSPSLMGKYQPGMWLSEAQDPINFNCPNCDKATVDLANPKYGGGELARLSVKPIQEKVYRGFFPWTIQCSSCQSIFDIHTGWVEPNNGRMIITLGDIREIKANLDISKYASELFHWSGDQATKYLTNYIKYLLALKIEFESISLALYIENTLGRSKKGEGVRLELFAPRYPDTATTIVSRAFAQAAKILLPGLSSRGSKMNTSFGLIISEVELLDSSTSVSIPFLTASQNAQLSPLVLGLLDILLHAANPEELIQKLSETGLKVKNILP